MKHWLPGLLVLLFVGCTSPVEELPPDLRNLENLTVYASDMEPASDISLTPEQFRWPRNRRVEVVRNGKLYALEEDTASGITKVVLYDIALGGEYGAEFTDSKTGRQCQSN